MYLREMGSVELLSREGEIAIAKRIEAGRDTMINGLYESPLTFEAILVWYEELNEGRILLRDIIDLDTTFGGGPEAQPDHSQRALEAAAEGKSLGEAEREEAIRKNKLAQAAASNQDGHEGEEKKERQ